MRFEGFRDEIHSFLSILCHLDASEPQPLQHVKEELAVDDIIFCNQNGASGSPVCGKLREVGRFIRERGGEDSGRIALNNHLVFVFFQLKDDPDRGTNSWS
jgi:hypothetical protein